MKYEEAREKANLTALQRRYLDLYISGHPVRLIARAHETTPSNVRGHIEAALKKIKPYMKEAT